MPTMSQSLFLALERQWPARQVRSLPSCPVHMDQDSGQVGADWAELDSKEARGSGHGGSGAVGALGASGCWRALLIIVRS